MATTESARTIASRLYDGIAGSQFQKLRPLICPFDELLAHVPPRSTVLDVGCGSGLLLGLIAAQGKLQSGLGFDTSRAAIARARQMKSRLDGAIPVEFQVRDVAAGWPEGAFDVVSLVDVMHHVPRAHQASVMELAASRVKPGGVLLYKDMVRRPFWRATMNRLHDLVLARQWIDYAAIEDVACWMRAAGLEVGTVERFDRLWYGHELLLAYKRRARPVFSSSIDRSAGAKGDQG